MRNVDKTVWPYTKNKKHSQEAILVSDKGSSASVGGDGVVVPAIVWYVHHISPMCMYELPQLIGIISWCRTNQSFMQGSIVFPVSSMKSWHGGRVAIESNFREFLHHTPSRDPLLPPKKECPFPPQPPTSHYPFTPDQRILRRALWDPSHHDLNTKH